MEIELVNIIYQQYAREIYFYLLSLTQNGYQAETVVKATETSSELNRMSLDYMVYSNLTMPGYYRDNVSVESRGFGKYSIEIMQTLS